MKQMLKFGIILLLCSVTSIQADDAQVKKASLEIIASISDDIATLIINHHHEKNSEVAKISCVKLVTTLADAIAQVICKIKERKENRSIDLYSDEEYDQALRLLSEELIHKICNQNDML